MLSPVLMPGRSIVQVNCVVEVVDVGGGAVTESSVNIDHS
jgi:sorbitol-specific phosphotransferase system component IIBC